MSSPSWTNGPPKKILIATDLSARSDRAFDRAVSLAAQWEAQLVVLHALENFEISVAVEPGERRPLDPASLARRELLADISDVSQPATVVVERDDPTEAIIRTAEAEGCDLIVTGVARDEFAGRFSLGGTVNRLLRCSRVPVLIVKSRVRGPYRRVVVATDFSPSSRHALEAAVRFFPGEKLTLLHAFDVDAILTVTTTDAALREMEARREAEEDCKAFLESFEKLKEGWSDPDVIIEEGPPDALLRDYVHHEGADLVVLGTHGRSALFEVLLGSVAKQILEHLPCDALVVREPQAAVEK